jgi:hypothetical protein
MSTIDKINSGRFSPDDDRTVLPTEPVVYQITWLTCPATF